MSFLSWIEIGNDVYMVTDHNVHFVSKMAEHVDPLGHDAIREVHHLLPICENERARCCLAFWEPSRYPEAIRPFLKDAETISHMWGKVVGYCMKEDDVKYVMENAPRGARRLVIDMLYSAFLSELSADRARLVLEYGQTWHLLPQERRLLVDFIEHGDYDPDRAAGKRVFCPSPA